MVSHRSARIGAGSPVQPRPHRGEGEPQNDVPDPPPRCDHRHAAETVEEIEDQHRCERSVLDAHLDAHGPAVFLGQATCEGQSLAQGHPVQRRERLLWLPVTLPPTGCRRAPSALRVGHPILLTQGLHLQLDLAVPHHRDVGVDVVLGLVVEPDLQVIDEVVTAFVVG